MRLISATLRNYRLHHELHVEFDRARTLIGGPNESGKSTLIEAIHRALFMRAKGATENYQQMLSTHRAAAPEVELVFETKEGTAYSLKKQFGTKGFTTLASSHAAQMSGAEAESELARLLSVEAGIAGRAMTAQWGHLWAWQGEAGVDPSAHATEHRTKLLQRLQAIGGGAVLQSELDTRVVQGFNDELGQLRTQAGKAKAGSELDRAESTHASTEAELTAASDKVTKLQVTVSDLEEDTRALEEVGNWLKELNNARHVAREKAHELAVLRNREAEKQRAVEVSQGSLVELRRRDEEVRSVRVQVAETESALEPWLAELSRLEGALRQAKHDVAAADEAYQGAYDENRTLRVRRDLASACATLWEKSGLQLRLSQKWEQIAQLKQERDALGEQMARLPRIDKAKSEQLQAMESAWAEANATLEAIATALEVTARDQDVTIDGEKLEEGESRIVTMDTTIRVGQGTMLRIRPGGGTTLEDARRIQDDAGKRLQLELDALGLPSVVEAAAAYSRREEIAARIGATDAQLDGMDANGVHEELNRTQIDVIASQEEVTRFQTLAPDEAPPLDAESAKGLAKLLTTQQAELDLREEQAKATHEGALAAAGRAESALQLARLERDKTISKLDTLREFHGKLVATHGEDSVRSGAITARQAQEAEVADELRIIREGISCLQPDLLEGDEERLDRALSINASEQTRLRTAIAVSRNVLYLDGSEDPTARLEAAQERAAAAKADLDGVRARADAVSLLVKLFQEEQQVLSTEFTNPLVEKITGYLQCIFGLAAHAQIELRTDEFVGLTLVRSASGGAVFDFESLSGGAKEQLASAVRLAMAEVLATDYDGCLPVVFDDAFANSDPERVPGIQRMLDLAARRGLQIIVLTCNHSDYTALGATLIRMNTPALPSASPGATLEEAATEAEDEPGEPSGADAVQISEQLRRTFLDVLTGDGGKLGNHAIRSRLGWDESIYEAVKEDLLARGLVLKGRGRGGTLSIVIS